MLMIKKLFKKNDSGFTLVELMAVVLIIGILVAIAIPMYNNSADNARRKTCDANVRTMNGALTQYEASGITTPASIGSLTTLGYLKATPVCPFGTAYSLDTITNQVTAHAHP